jgi:hypothetical protein
MLAVAVVVAAAMAFGTVASAEVFKPGVWVNGRAFDLVTEPYSPGTVHDLYAIAPIDIRHPQVPRDDAVMHGYGIHDHVFALPLGRTTFSGVCNKSLVLPGPRAKAHVNVEVRQTATPLGKKPLLYQARLGNALVNLTSVARIQRAIRLGLARVIPVFTLGCTITPHRQ